MHIQLHIAHPNLEGLVVIYLSKCRALWRKANHMTAILVAERLSRPYLPEILVL
jgi:hypothetical protein